MLKKLLSRKSLLISFILLVLISIVILNYNVSQSLKPDPSPSTDYSKGDMAPSVKDTPVAEQIIVQFKPEYSEAQINDYLKKYDARVIKTIAGINQTVVKVPAGKENAIVHQLKTDSVIVRAQRDYTIHTLFTPNDEGFGQQYGLTNTGQSILGKAGTANADIHVAKAWDITKGDGIKVAVLDTGVNLNHPDLAGKVIGQKSFISSTVEDQNGHGTHVAGIIAANTNNSIGIAGTCPNCKLIVGKIVDDEGIGTTSNAIAGITWAADQGAKVINLSVGTNELQTASLYNEAAQYAISKGSLVVAAAGNDNDTKLIYPAAAFRVVSVGATDNNDKKASWSNYGSTWIDLAAPGETILSTGPTHSFQKQPTGYSTSLPYFFLSGTSMAGPEVAGVAALVASTDYGKTPIDIGNRLLSTADKIDGTGTNWGYGRVNAANAVGATESATTTPTEISPTIYCVGGGGTAPCATIEPTNHETTPTESEVSPTTSSTDPTINPTPIQSGPTVTPGTPQPCATTSQSVSVSSTSDVQTLHKSHKKGLSNGWLSKFIEFLIQLIERLLQLIGVENPCLIPPLTGTPNAPGNPNNGGIPGQNQNPTDPPVKIVIPTRTPTQSGQTPGGSTNGNGGTNNGGSNTGTGGGSNTGGSNGGGTGGTTNGGGGTNGGNTGGSTNGGGNNGGSNGGAATANPYSPATKNPDATAGQCSGEQTKKGYNFCFGDGVNSGFCLPPGGACFASTIKGPNGSYCTGNIHQEYKPPTSGAASSQNRGTCQTCPSGGTVKEGATTCSCNNANQIKSNTEKTCVNKIVGCATNGHKDDGTCSQCVSGYTLQSGKCIKAPAGTGSDEKMPTGDQPGWKMIFSDDFTTDVPLGKFPSAVASKWDVYTDGTPDTAGNQGKPSKYYPSKVVSIKGGILNKYLHTENGTPMAAAIIPKLPGKANGQGQLYGKYVVRFRSDSLKGFKTAWLLWPDNGDYIKGGEVDYPEGDLDGPILAFLHHSDAAGKEVTQAFDSKAKYTSWHTATIEWLPNKISFMLDGKTIGSSTTGVPKTSMGYIIQTESCLSESGCPAASTKGNLQIDWVVIYAKK